MSVYMVTDENGDLLTDGLQEHEACRVAQDIANDHGESVWLSKHSADPDSNEEPEEVGEFSPKEFQVYWTSEDGQNFLTGGIFQSHYEAEISIAAFRKKLIDQCADTKDESDILAGSFSVDEEDMN